MSSELRHLPSVDKILSDGRIAPMTAQLPHSVLVDIARDILHEIRKTIAAGRSAPSFEQILSDIAERANGLLQPSLRRIINASGVLLHTNLGRAPVSKEAAIAMERISQGYCNLEFDTESGVRGTRHVHLERLLCQLTGAEAALVVNNNAAAVLLILTALARRKEVIVSRGQAVEIGGGFRIPDVMRQSGAKLVEVGTTNCTYAADYENAVTPQTAALLRVHPSNFKISGFTQSVVLEEMMDVADRHNLLMIDDLGSGCFIDVAQFGLASEPLVQQSVGLGALSCFSGDKLVGGPQAGIITGKKTVIDRLKKHSLSRALRIDKIRIAGLEVTLTHYIKGEALLKIPVWMMISASLNRIQERAMAWATSLGDMARVIDGETMIGGGSMPGGSMPTKLVAIGGDTSKLPQKFAHVVNRKLRVYSPSIVGRVDNDVLLLDPRTVLPEEDETILRALRIVCLS